MFGIIIVIFVS